MAITIPTVKIEVPVNDIEMHMVTCVEQGWFWFDWLKAEPTTDGYGRCEVMLNDNSYQLTEPYLNREGLKEHLTHLPDGAEILRWMNGYPVFKFDHDDFVRGLGLWLEKNGTRRTMAQVQYNGDGEWDIDAPGADAVVQLALLGEVVFG